MSGDVHDVLEVHCDNGETIYAVGKPVVYRGNVFSKQPPVLQIGEAAARGPGDRWNYLIILKDESAIRVFNMEKVVFGKPKKASKIAVPEKPSIII